MPPQISASSKKKPISFTNAERMRIRKKYHTTPGITQTALASWASTELRRDVTQTQVSRFLAAKYAYLDDEKTPKDILEANRDTSAKFPILEQALFSVIVSFNDKHIPVTGDIVRLKAQKLFESMPMFSHLIGSPQQPSFSNGWLESFKNRFGIKRFTWHGEAASVNIEEAWPRVLELRNIIALYSLDDVYNWDETGLFWRMVPNKTLATEARPGKKSQKVRLTINLCCNATGTHKIDLVYVDTAESPTAFQGKNISAMPMQWWKQVSAWMDEELSQKFIVEFWKATRPRRVLLLLDNLKAHESAVRKLREKQSGLFKTVQIEFLPKNSTSIFQPLDQGIIQCFKLRYRARWLRWFMVIADADPPRDPLKEVNKFHVARFGNAAWREVPTETIEACWIHSQLLGDIQSCQSRREALSNSKKAATSTTTVSTSDILRPHVRDDAATREAGQVKDELVQLCERVVPDASERDVSLILSPEGEHLVDADDPIEQAIQEFGGHPEADLEERESPLDIEPRVKHLEALNALQLLVKYEEQQQDASPELLRQLYTAERRIRGHKDHNLVQSSLNTWIQKE